MIISKSTNVKFKNEAVYSFLLISLRFAGPVLLRNDNKKAVVSLFRDVASLYFHLKK